MSAPKIVLTTVLTTLVVIIFTGVFAASLLPSGAIAHGGWQGGKHFGGHRGGHRGGLAQRCEQLSDDHTRIAGAVASAYLDLSSDQEQSLAPVLSIIDGWRVDSAQLCKQVAQAEQHDIDQGLAAMEAFLSRSATAVAELRPAVSTFQSALEPAQQHKIQQMLSRHQRPVEG